MDGGMTLFVVNALTSNETWLQVSTASGQVALSNNFLDILNFQRSYSGKFLPLPLRYPGILFFFVKRQHKLGSSTVGMTSFLISVECKVSSNSICRWFNNVKEMQTALAHLLIMESDFWSSRTGSPVHAVGAASRTTYAIQHFRLQNPDLMLQQQKLNMRSTKSSHAKRNEAVMYSPIMWILVDGFESYGTKLNTSEPLVLKIVQEFNKGVKDTFQSDFDLKCLLR